jgi:hypothetical protein
MDTYSVGNIVTVYYGYYSRGISELNGIGFSWTCKTRKSERGGGVVDPFMLLFDVMQ